MGTVETLATEKQQMKNPEKVLAKFVEAIACAPWLPHDPHSK